MKKLILACLAFFLSHQSFGKHDREKFSFFSTLPNNAAVTMTTWGSRFGDKIWNYLRAQWVAHISGLPFFYRPFKYSTELALHQHDAQLTQAIYESFGTHISILGKNPYQLPDILPTTQMLKDLGNKSHVAPTLYTTEACWCGFDYRSDPSFVQKMRSLIAPIQPLQLIIPPENCASLAIHLRTGVGYDSEEVKRDHPTRFLPHSFYARAIHDAIQHISTRPIFIYLFTDHPDPEQPIEDIKAELFALSQSEDFQNIEWQWRKKGNRHDKNVLEDFFSLLYFDCLIRPWSRFSACAEILADYAIAIDIHRDSNYSPIMYRIKFNPQSSRYAKLGIRNGNNQETLSRWH